MHADTILTVMPGASVVIVDTLNSLLEAERNSIIRFLGPGSPYLAKAPVGLRTEVEGWVAANDARSAELAATIQRLGGEPAPQGVQPEEQYLAHLSLRFLLPKLTDAKQLLIDRYDNALTVLKPAHTPAEVLEMLRRFRGEHAGHREALQKAMEEVLASKG